jgi:hypothetical protein
MKISSAKAKGRRFQKWIAERISEAIGIDSGKDEDIESREMGQQGIDIKLYGKAKELFPFSIEAKNQEKFYLNKWIKQAKENRVLDTDWLLFIKRNRFEPLVILDAEVFFRIYEECIKNKKER